MWRLFPLSALILLTLTTPAQARPVSYADGWMAMTMNDVDSNALQILYSPTAKMAYGLNQEYLRGPEASLTAAQVNLLLKRWNRPNSQANIYMLNGAGIAYGNGKTDPATYTGLEADWEDRRFYTSYETRALWADDTDKFVKHKARIGVAPYVGDVGDLHTWLMLLADYDAGNRDKFSLTPLVRVFKGDTLLEAGYNLDNGLLFNLTQTF